MRIALWNWHTPYVTLLANAMPEVDWLVLHTVAHAPNSWRLDQRPKPVNVYPVSPFREYDADMVILQNGRDMAALPDQHWSGPLLFLAHNRAEFEDGVVFALDRQKVPVVAISAMKAETYREHGYTHPIEVIPPGLPTEDYGGWRGDVPKVLTVVNNLRRPLFDVEAWLEATRGLPVTLVGEGNEGLPGAVGPARDFDHLLELYRSHRVYLNPTKWPYENFHNLALLEAAAIGMPPVALTHPEAPQGIFRGQADEVRRELEDAIEGRDWALAAATVGRRWVEETFAMAQFSSRWRTLLKEVAGG